MAQQSQQSEDRAAAAQEEERGIEEKREQVQEELREFEQESAAALELLQEEERTLRAYDHETGDLQRSLAEQEAAGEEIKTAIVDLLTQEAQAQNSLAYARRRASEVEQRLQALAREAERVAALRAETEHALAQVQARVARIQERLLAGQRQREVKTDDLREIAGSTEQLERELTGAWARQAELRARLQTLQSALRTALQSGSANSRRSSRSQPTAASSGRG